MPDLQVASTTDTQEQVNQAAGAVEEVKEKGDEQVDSEEKEQQEQPQKTAKESQEKHKPDEKLLKRVDKLTAQKTAAEGRAAKLEAELAEARKPKTSEEPKKEEPKAIPETFPKYQVWADKRLAESKPAELEDWLEERDAWKENKRKADEEKEEIAEKVREINEIYQERAAAFKETVDDWDEVIATLRGHLAMQDALLEMEEGPALAYYIAKHPDVSKRLIEMTPARAVAEVGRMAAELFPKGKESDIRGTERKGPDKLPVSSAPAPIKLVSGHSTRSPKALDELPYDEYRKERDKQEKERYRR